MSCGCVPLNKRKQTKRKKREYVLALVDIMLLSYPTSVLTLLHCRKGMNGYNAKLDLFFFCKLRIQKKRKERERTKAIHKKFQDKRVAIHTPPNYSETFAGLLRCM